MVTALQFTSSATEPDFALEPDGGPQQSESNGQGSVLRLRNGDRPKDRVNIPGDRILGHADHIISVVCAPYAISVGERVPRRQRGLEVHERIRRAGPKGRV